MKKCGTCKWFEGPKSSRFKQAGRCVWPEADRTAELPDSITMAYDYRPTHLRKAAWFNEGTSCPTWEERT